MKINNSGVKSAQTAALQSKDLEKTLKTTKGAQVEAQSSIEGSAKINMSDKAQAFQKAKAIASADTIDEAKVARLQKLIDEGKYKVDAQAVADRLIDEQIATGE